MTSRKCGCFMMVLLCLVVQSMGLSYTVGDSSGWTLGVDYAAWSSSKTFVIGDTLVFKYGSGHIVDEVSESDYNTCNVGDPINRDNKGITTILLQTPGNRFFICGVIGHCGSGMKFSIHVLPSGGITPPPTVVAPGGATNSATATMPPNPTSGNVYGGVLPVTTTTIPDFASSAPASLVSFHGGVRVLTMILGLAYVYMF